MKAAALQALLDEPSDAILTDKFISQSSGQRDMWQDPTIKKKRVQSTVKAHADPLKSAKHKAAMASPEMKKSMSEQSKARFKDPAYMENHSKKSSAWQNTPEALEWRRQLALGLMADPEIVAKIGASVKATLAKPEVKKKMVDAQARLKADPARWEAAMAKQREQITCQHCGKVGGKTIMKRWHFDNCKSKP